MFDVLIVGGGAAGFYAAIHIAAGQKNVKVAILERGKEVLTKVKVSGGGRCNVTHAEFDPNELVTNYPRGGKELLGPFHRHCTGDTVQFFEERNVPLKIEEDGRMFPVSNSSQSIVDCLLAEADRLGVHVYKHSAVTDMELVKTSPEPYWKVTSIRKEYKAKKLLVATGSSPKIWSLLERLGHTIDTPIPSLFTFNSDDIRIKGIQGVSTNARVSILKPNLNPKITIRLASQVKGETLLTEEGPVLITHWGLSGPAILRLSAWGAKLLNDRNYKFTVRINWVPEYHEEALFQVLLGIKEVEPKKTVLRTKALDLPRRLWTNLVKASGIDARLTWADISKELLQQLALQLTACEIKVHGKSTFKEEFVTAGGVNLKEINFKNFESKLFPNLFFAGEVINVDAITGGFNFQNAWTGGYIAAQGILE